ncbi:hypothetical protein E0I74_20740 [Rhizobium laguerreae]|nr:hypothetical protein [Rhizobium laguerreae]NKM19285.1 hypothetical protein [Rhizobium laguerreae]NKM33358.1 hypothetical protein [Rhizobium laguerreae]NKM40465.1 hypothetical protein [Rhizobium laguerreae]NKM69762.1 hypothetical protein [Rhizobium laguerreae]
MPRSQRVTPDTTIDTHCRPALLWKNTGIMPSPSPPSRKYHESLKCLLKPEGELSEAAACCCAAESPDGACGEPRRCCQRDSLVVGRLADAGKERRRACQCIARPFSCFRR